MYGTPLRHDVTASLKKLPVAYGSLEDFLLEYNQESYESIDPSLLDDIEDRTLKGRILSCYRAAEDRLLDKIDFQIHDLHQVSDIWGTFEHPESGERYEREFIGSIHHDAGLVRNAIATSVTCLPAHQRKELQDTLLADLLEVQEYLVEAAEKKFSGLRLVANAAKEAAATRAAEIDQLVEREERESQREAEEEIRKFNLLPKQRQREVLTAQHAANKAATQKLANRLFEASSFGNREAAGKRKTKKLWAHLTISRDQTAASDFKRELLLSLRSTNLAIRKDTLELGPDEIIKSVQRSDPLSSLESKIGPACSESTQQNLATNTPRPMRQAASSRTKESSKAQLTFSAERTATGILASPSSKSMATGRPRGADARNRYVAEEPQSDHDGDGGDIEGEEDPRATIRRLEDDIRRLKGSTIETFNAQTLYFLKQSPRDAEYVAYLDEPSWYVDADGHVSLKSRSPISDITAYLDHRQNTSFVVSKFYDHEKQEKEVKEACKMGQMLPAAEASYEDLLLKAEPLKEAAEAFAKLQPNIDNDFPGLDINDRLAAPYMFWYRYRSPNALDQLDSKHKEMMTHLTTWIEDNYRELYEKVHDQLQRGVISPETMQFLIRPGDVVVSKEKKELSAVIARSWPCLSFSPEQGSSPGAMRWGKKLSTPDKLPKWTWSFDCRSYQYDGSFYTYAWSMDTVIRAKTFKDEVAINELSAFPLQYASEEWKTTLERRGKTFWSCRKRRLVGYEDDRGFYGSSDRFMTDFDTYAQIHSDDFTFKRTYPHIDDPTCDRMDPQIMESNDPPTSPEIYIFPNSIVAYNLRSKKWIDLEVDRIREVKWNKASFDHLVVDHETKELVQALVTNQIAMEKGTDIIESKGNGLIILLHGGPGTGKTFTAESVAELAEKPLFRVTCGDIGTKPEDVEKYLESVLHLGKSWGCVVLLDEAEVFLEQRQLTDLDRNALVSVFLRVLEYYEGILILTSNRVATFDEAFKSRIQLSLHYEDLTEGQRFQIWRNFLSRLKGLEGKAGDTTDAHGKAVVQESLGIDFGEIECYIGELAKYEMNGRQIRNAITTARQLAAFKKEKMSLKHLKHVIGVSNKFDKYLKTVTDGFGDGWGTRGGGYS